MPDNQSKEKMDTLRALGAELVLVPPTKYADPCHFQHVSRRMAEETEGAIGAGQFDNTANRRAHIEGTAQELWEQTGGEIDGFTCAAGTGGTIAGVGMGLKEKDERVRIALTDPHGAALYNYYAHGELKGEGSSVAEGIGQGRITANLEGAPIDTQFRISDEEGLVWVEKLLRDEGLCLGLSSGINVAGAIELGKQLVAEGKAKNGQLPQVAQIVMHLQAPLLVTGIEEVLAEAGRAAEIRAEHRIATVGQHLVQ